MVFYTGIILTLSAVIFFQAPGKMLNRSLSLFLLSFAYMGVTHFLYASRLFHPAVIALNMPVVCYIGILFYQFARSLENHTYKTGKAEKYYYAAGLYFLVYTILRFTLPEWRSEILEGTRFINGRLARNSTKSLSYYFYFAYIILPILLSYYHIYNSIKTGPNDREKRNRIVFYITFLFTMVIVIGNAMILPILGRHPDFTVTNIAMGIAVLAISLTVFRQKYWDQEVLLEKLSVQELMLREQNARLEKMMVDREYFFDSVSHELKTPLALIINPLQRIIENVSIKPEEVRPALVIVLKNAETMLREVNNLMDMSRMLNVNKECKKYPLNLHNLVSLVTDIFNSYIENRDIVIYFISDSHNTLVYSNQEYLEKIIRNILGNALKFTNSGKVTVSLKQSDEDIILDVTDTGPGIPAGLQDFIFQPYHRGSQDSEGLGLGLAIAKQASEMIDAELILAESSSKGTKFRLLVPVYKNNPDLEEFYTAIEPKADRESIELETDEISDYNKNRYRTESPDIIKLNKYKSLIILVEDNRDLSGYLCELLQEKYHVIKAYNGIEAFHFLELVDPDLVITDVMMPDMGGIELVKKLRHSSEFQDTPVLMISARSGEDNRIKGFEAGADDYLEKPFTDKEFKLRVDNLVKQTNRVDTAKKTERKKFFQDLHDHLGGQLLDIKIIVEQIEKGHSTIGLGSLKEKIQKISDFIRMQLNGIEEIHFLENDIVSGLQVILLKRYQTASRTFQFIRNNIDERYPAANFKMAESLAGIFYEIVNNDIKYGIGAPRWEVTFIGEGLIRIKFSSASIYGTGQRPGKGTTILRERVESIRGIMRSSLENGEYRLEIELVVMDNRNIYK